MNVLVVDDSEIACAMMTQSLETHGCRVLSLGSPFGVTRAIVREKIDVVVIDVNLPSASGDRLALLLRKHGRMEGLGVVLVSGIPRGELDRLGRESEADAVVHKEDLAEQLPFAVMHAFRLRR